MNVSWTSGFENTDKMRATDRRQFKADRSFISISSIHYYHPNLREMFLVYTFLLELFKIYVRFCFAGIKLRCTFNFRLLFIKFWNWDVTLKRVRINYM